NLAKTILMVEKDEDIAAVWRTLLGREGKWLADQIMQFEVTLNNVQAIFNQPITSVRQRAFTTILKNRLFHGGILAEGSGLLKYGENGKGLLSRWYPKTLRNRILAIQSIKQKILFAQGDGFEVMEKNKNKKNVAYFIDPPYTKAAKRLYRHFEINHQYLFELTKQLTGDFLMTYDDTEEIRLLARKHRFDTESILMRSTHHIKKTELLIGNNLGWLREDF
ncbi:MAG: DNA adenine methylase, partial [Nitrospinales bacterium]